MILFNKQKAYFKTKLDSVQKMVWDLEFKRAKTQMIREEIRQEYDRGRAQLEILTAQIRGQLKTPDKVCPVHNQEAGKEPVHKSTGQCVCEYIDGHMDVNEIERLYDRVFLLNRDTARFKEQMLSLDIEVNGAKPTSENREGATGINQQIDSLRELMGMLQDYIKSI